MLRYKYLMDIIHEHKPKTIVEIGSRSGVTGKQMMRAASKHHNKSELMYYGFDLWEKLSRKRSEQEFNGKSIVGIKVCRQTLKGFPHVLTRGDTRKTLPKFVPDREIDFVFIDGGHSIETIASDWSNVEKWMSAHTVVVFDDFYHNRDDFGCAQLIRSLGPEYKVTPIGEPDKIGNTIQLMQVTFDIPNIPKEKLERLVNANRPAED